MAGDLCQIASIVKPEGDQSYPEWMRFWQKSLSFFAFIWVSGAWALTYQLELKENVAIYAQPREGARVVRRAEAGEKFVTGRRPQKGFYKIKFLFKGKMRNGYIAMREAGYSRVIEIKEHLRDRHTLGFSTVISAQSQGARSIETTPGTEYSISEFKGRSTFFRIFTDIPISEEWATRIALVLRETSMKGDASFTGGGGTSKVHLQQSFIGAEALLKRYLYQNKFWVGGDFEASRGTKVSLEVMSGPSIDGSGVEKPFFAILALSAGYDLALLKTGSGTLYFTPEFKFGGVVTTDPVTYLTEGIANLAWGF